MTDTKLNRRSFLSAAAAALVLDPDRLLWVPGAKVYSIPKPKPLFRFDMPLTIHSIVHVSSISFDILVSFAGGIPQPLTFKWLDNGRICLEERS